MDDVVLKPAEFVALVNQTFEYAYPQVTLEGEISGFNINQGKYIFFDIKDEEASVSCFMMLWQAKQPLADGMQVRLSATVRLTNKGRFSLTVRSVVPVGEGSQRRAYELLKSKLTSEGLFAPERKRILPVMPARIGLISSTGAAGAKDFLTVLAKRWNLSVVNFAHVTVQGESAPDQIVRAVEYFNAQPRLVDVLVVVRGGGSLDDLSAFNTEPVARAIAGSRIPTLVGVGHEQDVTLADLAADVRAATPTDAAVNLVPNQYELLEFIADTKLNLQRRVQTVLSTAGSEYRHRLVVGMSRILSDVELKLSSLSRALIAYNPTDALKRGYSILSRQGSIVTRVKQLSVGVTMAAQLSDGVVNAKVTDVKLQAQRHN